MGESKAIEEQEFYELPSTIKQLTKSIENVPDKIAQVEQKLESKVDHVVTILEEQDGTLRKHHEIIFGNGEDQRGIVGKQHALEDRLQTFWWAVGIVGTASIYELINIMASYFKK
jgi:archaellum component FlaC